MKYWIEFLRILDKEKIFYRPPIVTGKIEEEGKEINFEIGLDKSGDRVLIVFEDIEFTTEIKTDELIKTARNFAKRKR